MATKRDDKDVVGDAVEHGADQVAEIGRRQAEQTRALLGVAPRLAGDASEGVEGLIESSSRLAKGAQDVGWEVMHYTRQSLQLGMRCANEMMTCRTVEDMLKVHSNFVRQSMDSLLQESVRLMELSTGTAQSAVGPIQSRLDLRQQ